MINDLLKEIEESTSKFIDGVPAIQKKIYEKLLLLLKDLDLYADGSIKNNLTNIVKIGKIKKALEKIILDRPYIARVQGLLDSFSVIQKIQNDYFARLAGEQFNPKKVYDVVVSQAQFETAERLTESGIRADIVAPLQDIIRTNITAGGKYSDLAQSLRDVVIGNEESDGLLQKYADTYVTDAVNTFSRQYGELVTDDLGLDWFKFSGTLITTSRPMCQEMHNKYFHRSQFPDLVAGIVDGKQTPLGKNGLPLGFKEGTTPDNYLTLLNGWNCPHQMIAVSRAVVPKDVLDAVEEEV